MIDSCPDHRISAPRRAAHATGRMVLAGLLVALLSLGGSQVLAQTAGAAPARTGSATSVKSITTTLTGSAARKECITISNHQRLRYWYRAEGPINFDIQYVDAEANKTVYAVRRDKAAIGLGTFWPRSEQDYCLVWTNLASHAVTLTFEFARVDN